MDTDRTLVTFEDGDVLLKLSSSVTMQLHAAVLRRNSKLLSELVAEECSAILTPQAKNKGVRIRYRLELVERPPMGQVGAGKLIRVELDDNGRVIDDIEGKPRRHALPDLENGKIPHPIYKHYANVIGAYYNREIILDHSSITPLLHDALMLLEVASYLGSISVVSKSIDLALLNQGQTLYRSIQTNPTAWIKLAHQLKSEILFQEALIHLVGSYNSLTADQKSELSNDVMTLIDKKHLELLARSQDLEAKVFRLYPRSMRRDATLQEVGRAAYSSDIYAWIALCVLRHWLGDQIAMDRGHHAPDGGYALYCKLAQGGMAYIDRTDLGPFFGMFPMSVKAKACVENCVLEIKELVRRMVEGSKLLNSNLALDVGKYGVDYLTDVKVAKGEFPWLKG
ncbi:hypothetical protein H2201_003696 [Coniosporium apollinis]|uniref:BTB domain-containing protein n=1 Tax=Coniosporium apollinis TaxID=61459 RepID=A0ABQ9P1J1_9PEZI|nr:hypothetical protein H2201_003696 [Coniosporium apollinis]